MLPCNFIGKKYEHDQSRSGILFWSSPIDHIKLVSFTFHRRKSITLLQHPLPLHFTFLNMFQATAQKIAQKLPQQTARIQRTFATDSFAFYPVQSNRIRTTVAQNPKTRECFSFYPANVAERQLAAPTIMDVKAVRATLLKNKKTKASLKNLDSVLAAKTTKKISKALA